MDAIRLDQLPDLCLRKIFKFLSLRDLVRCRAVSRQFKFYSDEIGVNELVVTSDFSLCLNLPSRVPCTTWYITNTAINFENYINPDMLVRCKSSPLKLVQQLKFLHLHVYEGDFNVKILNHFKQLVHLEIYLNSKWFNRVRRARRNGPKTLILPNLKVLVLRDDPPDDSNAPFALSTPKLEVLMCKKIRRIQAEYPEAIKRLSCDYSGENEAMKFKNLQILDYQCKNDNLDQIPLSTWRHLKELNLEVDQNIFWRSVRDEVFRNSLVHLLGQKETLKREELKLYLNDVLLSDAKQLPDLENVGDESLLNHQTFICDYFWFKNHQVLRRATYPGRNFVNFNKLVQQEVHLSADFFVRFPQIRNLTAAGLVSRDAFECFLEHASALRALRLTNTLLDQTFMDNLPNINRRLISLEVNGSSVLVANFNFILQFEQLEEFQTDRQFGSLELASTAFRQLKELQYFRFKAGDKHVRISRDSRTRNEFTLRFSLELRATRGDKVFYSVKWAELETLYDRMGELDEMDED